MLLFCLLGDTALKPPSTSPQPSLQMGFGASNKVLRQSGVGFLSIFCRKGLRGKAGRGKAAVGRAVTRQDPAWLSVTQEPNPTLSYNPSDTGQTGQTAGQT